MKSLEQLERDLQNMGAGRTDTRSGHTHSAYYLHRRLEIISEILIEILREVRNTPEKTGRGEGGIS